MASRGTMPASSLAVKTSARAVAYSRAGASSSRCPEDGAGGKTLRGIEPALPHIDVVEVPGVSHRRVAVTDMQLPGMFANRLAGGVAADQHQVVAAGVEARKRQRHQRQELRIAPDR